MPSTDVATVGAPGDPQPLVGEINPSPTEQQKNRRRPETVASVSVVGAVPSPARTQRRREPSGWRPRPAVSGFDPAQPDLAGEEDRDHLVNAVFGQDREVSHIDPCGGTEIPTVNPDLMSLAAEPKHSLCARLAERPNGRVGVGDGQLLKQIVCGACGTNESAPSRRPWAPKVGRGIGLAGRHGLDHPAMHVAEVGDQVADPPTRTTGRAGVEVCRAEQRHEVVNLGNQGNEINRSTAIIDPASQNPRIPWSSACRTASP